MMSGRMIHILDPERGRATMRKCYALCGPSVATNLVATKRTDATCPACVLAILYRMLKAQEWDDDTLHRVVDPACPDIGIGAVIVRALSANCARQGVRRDWSQ